MIIDLLKYQSMTVYFPDGTRLLISNQEDGDTRVEHICPELNQIINYFIANETHPPDPPDHSHYGGTG